MTWTFDDGHTPFNIMNLYEGNVGEMWGMDGYFGGSGYGTVPRNYFTGFNPNYGVAGEAIQLLRLGYNYNIVGNVLGSTSQNPQAYTGCSMYGSGTTWIYRLGYPNSGNCGLGEDTRTARSPRRSCAGATTITLTRRRGSSHLKCLLGCRYLPVMRFLSLTTIRAHRPGGQPVSRGRRSALM